MKMKHTDIKLGSDQAVYILVCFGFLLFRHMCKYLLTWCHLIKVENFINRATALKRISLRVLAVLYMEAEKNCLKT